jgi:hypothetical protein
MSLLLLPFNIFRFANGAQDTMLCSIVLWGSLWYVSSPVGGWVVGCWVLGLSTTTAARPGARAAFPLYSLIRPSATVLAFVQSLELVRKFVLSLESYYLSLLSINYYCIYSTYCIQLRSPLVTF